MTRRIYLVNFIRGVLIIDSATTSSSTLPENLLEFVDGEDIQRDIEERDSEIVHYDGHGEEIHLRRPSSPTSSIGISPSGLLIQNRSTFPPNKRKSKIVSPGNSI